MSWNMFEASVCAGLLIGLYYIVVCGIKLKKYLNALIKNKKYTLAYFGFKLPILVKIAHNFYFLQNYCFLKVFKSSENRYPFLKQLNRKGMYLRSDQL
jgi:hypothetical protein